MLIKEGDYRSDRIDLRLAISLAALAGAVNASAFLIAGYFSANMTGNVSALSEQAAMGQWGLAAPFLVIVLAFIVGALVATLLVRAGQARKVRGIFALIILGEGVLIAAIGGLHLLVPTPEGGFALVAGLAFSMGLQNAASTLISRGKVRTTHVSGIATDIGIELAGMFDTDREQRSSTRARLKLHALSILAFLLGGIAGVYFYLTLGDVVFVIAGAVLVLLATPFVIAARQDETSQS